jgi:hypothetical protein
MKSIISLLNHKQIFVAIIFLLAACGGEQSSSDQESNLEDVQIDEGNEELKKEFREAIDKLPSPLDISKFIQETGAAYMPDILNKYQNVDNYSSTSFKRALNLGVYGADLGYSCVYYNVPDVLQFMDASKKLSEELGIAGVFEQDKVQKFEQSLVDRDSLIKVVTENIYMADQVLIENDNLDVAALVLAGSWVEGLYISTSIVKNYPRDIPEEFILQILNPIINEISNQGETLSQLQEILNKFPDNAQIVDLNKQLTDLSALYASFADGEVEDVANDDVNESPTGPEVISLTTAQLEQITTSVEKIRSNMVR